MALLCGVEERGATSHPRSLSFKLATVWVSQLHDLLTYPKVGRSHPLGCWQT